MSGDVGRIEEQPLNRLELHSHQPEIDILAGVGRIGEQMLNWLDYHWFQLVLDIWWRKWSVMGRKC